MKSKEELGKHLLNIGVAVIVFAVLQSIMNNKVDFVKVVVFAIVYILIASTGYFLIKASEDIKYGENR